MAVRPAGGRRRRLRALHRWTGLLAGVFLLLLAVTGVLINHSHQLGLDRRPVESSVLHDWYGLPAPAPVQAVSLQAVTVYGADEAVVVNDYRHSLEAFRGAVEHGDLVLVAGASELLLLTPGGEAVERVDFRDRGPIEALGRAADGRTLLRTPAGILAGDDALLVWLPAPGAQVAGWRIPQALGRDAARPDALGHRGLTWEQVLLDLHAGRLFGITGTLLNDLAAVAIGYLFISGLTTWRRNGRSRRPRNGD